MQGLADQVGGQQRDVVLLNDFCGLVQRQPFLADFVWGMACCFLCCGLRVVLVDGENRCEMFLLKQLT